MKKIILMVVMVGLVGIGLACQWAWGQGLNPILLWEKTLPFKIDSIEMAKGSGDIIFISNYQIIFYDKNGYKRFHWGPRVDRTPSEVDISDDGNIITYQTNWTENYVWRKGIDLQKSGWDNRIHYCTKKGKELWNYKIAGVSYLSPDGSMVAVGPGGGEGWGLTILDSTGKLFWKYSYEISGDAYIDFSPDSEYIGLCDEGILRLFNRNGNLLMEKAQCDGIVSISDSGNYISTYPHYELEKSHKGKVYDKNGNVVFEGFGAVSANGTRVSLLHGINTIIYSLPDKTILKEYPIQGSEVTFSDVILSSITFSEITLSSDGRFTVVVGTRTDTTSTNNIFVIDIQEDRIWETYVEGDTEKNEPQIFLTKDGKYLLICNYERKKLIYYQLY